MIINKEYINELHELIRVMNNSYCDILQDHLSRIKKLFFLCLERPEFVPKIGGRCMKIHPDGLSIAIGDRNGNIRIFDIQTFKQIAIVEAHDSEVLSVDYGQSSDMSLYFNFIYLGNNFLFLVNRNQILTKENTSLKQRLESAEEKLNALQKVNEVS